MQSTSNLWQDNMAKETLVFHTGFLTRDDSEVNYLVRDRDKNQEDFSFSEEKVTTLKKTLDKLCTKNKLISDWMQFCSKIQIDFQLYN